MSKDIAQGCAPRTLLTPMAPLHGPSPHLEEDKAHKHKTAFFRYTRFQKAPSAEASTDRPRVVPNCRYASYYHGRAYDDFTSRRGWPQQSG